jgi:chromosome segregation ATPase
MLFDLNPTYITLITAIFGGAGVEVFKKILTHHAEDFSDASRIRDELRQHIESLQKEIDDWKREADTWREKYWIEVEQNVSLRGDYETLRVELATLKDKHTTSE